MYEEHNDIQIEEGKQLYSKDAPPEESEHPNQKRLMIMCLCLSLFSTNLVSSMCAPFYPRSAARHGLSSDMTGSILGVYYATIVIASPILAIFMTKIGQANMLQAGLLLVGFSSALFGVIDDISDSMTFGIVSFSLRSLQGIGCAATDTAVFAIASARFAERLGKVNSYLNISIGLSFMLGPPIGGLLYSWVNFFLPFGFSAFLCLLSVFWVHGVFRNMRESKMTCSSVSPKVVLMKGYHLLSHIRFTWIVVTAICGTACTSFLDPTLEPYISSWGFTNTAVIGIFYLVRDVAFTLGTPPVGALLDKKNVNPNILLAIGAITAGIGYNIIGILGVYTKAFTTVRICVALVFIGVGQSPVFCATLPAMVREAKLSGTKYDDDLCGVLAAIQNLAFYGGLWAGSVISGVTTYSYGFPLATAGFGAVVIVVSLTHINLQVFARNKNTLYESLNSQSVEPHSY